MSGATCAIFTLYNSCGLRPTLGPPQKQICIRLLTRLHALRRARKRVHTGGKKYVDRTARKLAARPHMR
jgi:hypothetical protein